VVIEQLETEGYWSDVRTGWRRKEVTEVATLRNHNYQDRQAGFL
jgi:hypothetical protein